MKTEIAKLIFEMNQCHPNADYLRNAKLDEITALLSKDAANTIDFLNQADEDVIAEILGIIDEVSYNLQSLAYISCIEGLVSKFPNLNVQIWLDNAKDAMN